MEAYTDFASVYDTFMDETPYEVWGNFIAELIEKYGVSRPVKIENVNEKAMAFDKNENAESDLEADVIEDGSQEALDQEKNLVVELGCGTGSFTIRMAKKGYDIMGIDVSPDMLDIARNIAAREGLNLMFIEQDM